MEPQSLAAELAGATAPAEPATITPATTWGKPARYRLPSGHVALLKRVSLIALAGAGSIPNPLATDALRLLAVDDPDPSKLTEAQQIKAYQRNAAAFVHVAQRVLVEPKLITDREPDYEAGEIGPGDLADQDYTWIYYRLVGGRDDDVATFRVR